MPGLKLSLNKTHDPLRGTSTHLKSYNVHVGIMAHFYKDFVLITATHFLAKLDGGATVTVGASHVVVFRRVDGHFGAVLQVQELNFG